jgi:glycosyltransferase involved in cell wall biosynthesis
MASNLQFYYGSGETKLDITTLVYKDYKVGKYIILPKDDARRSKLFTDPCPSVVKSIYVHVDSVLKYTFDASVDVVIDVESATSITDKKILRSLVRHAYKTPKEQAEAMHSYISLYGGSMKDEFPEQCMIVSTFTGKEKVLEIGGNIGRGSLLIASLLEDTKQFVVLESSKDSSNLLNMNRIVNDFQFHIETSALSIQKLIQRGWTTIASDTLLDGYTPVDTITYKELLDKYPIQFDTLVLDCEGAFYFILKDFPELLDTINLILIENDFRSIEHKVYIDACLRKNKFKCTYKEKGSEEAERLGFPCLTNFYEVWRKGDSTSIDLIEPILNPVVKPIIEPMIKPTQAVNTIEAPIWKGGKFMDAYPCLIFFRSTRYKAVDAIFDSEEAKKKLHCSICITNDPKQLNLLFDPNYPVLITYGDTEQEYYSDIYKFIADRMAKRWVHYKSIESIDQFVSGVNHCFIHNVLLDRTTTRPTFSIFTTCYKSYEKIDRAYQSILKQSFRDWEWVLLDDSPEDAHFAYLKSKFSKDKRVRLYKRDCNSGNIGNVKQEVVSLCRGSYVLEMDHDDEILPNTLQDASSAFVKHPDVGFVYMDFTNIYENGSNFSYGDFISKGYGGYYMEKYNGSWVNVYITPNLNNITLSHIVCLPNHPRIWRKSVIDTLGSYSEFLPICDDQELLMRTAMQTKCIKIPKLSYVQYMNANNNNFSLIRNSEINRIGPHFIVPQFYTMYKVHEKMKELDAHEDETYVYNCLQIWKRPDNYVHKYCNLRILEDYTCQYCILGINAFEKNLSAIYEAYKNPKHDFILLDGFGNKEALCFFLDAKQMTRMKCYSLENTPKHELLHYFNRLYKTCSNTIVFE